MSNELPNDRPDHHESSVIALLAGLKGLLLRNNSYDTYDHLRSAGEGL